MNRLSLNDATVIGVAALLGCQPDNGLAHELAQLLDTGRLHATHTVGDAHRAFLVAQLDKSLARALNLRAGPVGTFVPMPATDGGA